MARVLVVDDNEQNRYLLETLLSAHGHEVVASANGSEALELARRDPPDIVVTDILMPGMDGFALCRHWKTDEVLKQRPLVFYTATYTDPRDEQLADDLGADHFISKPSEPEELIKALESILLDNEPRTREPLQKPEQLRKRHNEAIARKLEDKVAELSETNQQLEQRIAELNAAQEALRLRDRALAATSCGVIITDATLPDHPIVSVNKAYETTTGYTEAESRGKNCRFLQGADRDQDGIATLRKSIANGEPCLAELRNYRKDGTLFWSRMTISPVRDADGNLTHFVGIQDDITASREAEEALKRNEALLRTITNEIPHAMLVVGEESDTVEYFNEQFLALWNIPHLAEAMRQGQLPGTDVISSCLPQVVDAAAFLSCLRAFEGGSEEDTIDDEVELIDGRTVRRFCTRIVSQPEAPPGRLYMFEDITDRKHSEQIQVDRAAAEAKLSVLSDREREVLDLLVTGIPNKAIAAKLAISERTVERHRSNLMHKLRINNVPELVRLRVMASPE